MLFCFNLDWLPVPTGVCKPHEKKGSRVTDFLRKVNFSQNLLGVKNIMKWLFIFKKPYSLNIFSFWVLKSYNWLFGEREKTTLGISVNRDLSFLENKVLWRTLAYPTQVRGRRMRPVTGTRTRALSSHCGQSPNLLHTKMILITHWTKQGGCVLETPIVLPPNNLHSVNITDVEETKKM